jgi:acylglycerol lipase
MKKHIQLVLLIPLLFFTARAADQSNSLFSFSELLTAKEKYIAPIKTVEASDGISLAFRSYLPDKAKAVLVFYHGAGVHSGLSYNHLSIGLRDEFNIAVFTPDVRGHGFSEGPRGDTPETEQVWRDINTIIQYARSRYPDLPLFLGGHSAGSGLSLNYSSWSDRLPVDGYVFVAPYFGYKSETDRENKKSEFTTVKVSNFVINSMTGGLLKGHAKAIQYHYPEEILKRNPEIVTFNTVNMSLATTPNSPNSQFSGLKRFGVWIGRHDESFDPDKVVQFAEQNKAGGALAEIRIIEDRNHFSILLMADELIGAWIHSHL